MNKTNTDKIHISHLIKKLENLPITREVLVDQIRKAAVAAKRDAKMVHMSWAGMFDLIVWPNGNFQLVPLMEFKVYSLVSDTHCREEYS